MTDRMLAAFAAAQRTGSFSTAAWELSMSQQAVSYSIKRLEEELGFPLFVRRSSRVELTFGGEQFLRWYTVLDRGAEELTRQFPGSVPEGSVSDNHVRCFLTAARGGSLSRAAEYLFYTPQNLLSILAALEKALGVSLFEKERDDLSLTEAGSAWHNFFEEASASLRAVRNYAREEYEDRKACAVVGVSEWLSAGGILGDVLKDFGAEVMSLPNRELLDALEAGHVDAALWSEGHAPVNRGLEIAPVAEEDLCLYVPDGAVSCPLLACPGWPRSFLENRAITTQEMTFGDFTPSAVLLTETLEELLRHMETGAFAAVGDRRFGRFSALSGLRTVPLGERGHVVLCRKTNAGRDRAAALADALRAALVGGTKD